MAVYGDERKLNGIVLASITQNPKHIDGIGIVSVEVNSEGHLLVTLTNDEIIDAGFVGNAEALKEFVDEWLDEHPEATTTVQDGAITEPKLAAALLAKFIEIDPTLTQSGEAADAKEVGDAFRAVFGAITTDTTLSVAGKPADAKTTGDAINSVDRKVSENREGILALDSVKANNTDLTPIRNGVSANADNIATQTARIDNLISGTTPSGSELIDGRVSYNQITYPTLGDAMRAQAKGAVDYAAVLSEAKKAELFTNGHLKEIPICYNSKMKLWNTQTSAFQSTEISSTDYILVDSDVYVSFMADSAAFNSTYIRIQFYDVDTFEFKPEILVRNTASTGANNIYTEQLKTIGFRVAINSPVYMKVAKGNAKNIRVFTWDKEHFGLPLAATATMIGSNGNKIYLPSEGYACVTIPREAKFIFAKEGYTITNLWACRSGDTYTKRVETNAVPTQCLTIPKVSGDLFYRATVVKNYNYSTGTFEKYQYCGDNDAISVYTDSAVTNTGVVPNGKYNVTNAKAVLERAKKINSIEWTCLKDTDADGHKVDDGKNGGYKAGVKYRGVPYGTNWVKAHFFGWHVSAHTFLSAANDIDSIFYTPAHDVDDKRAPYYSLVCSSYTTLASGFLCPHQNFSLMNNPKVQITQLNAPQAGQMATNGIGHCIIYGETYNSANTGEIEFCECASPLSKNSVTYSDIIKSNSVTVSEANNYTGDYRYMVSDFYNPNRVSDSTRIYPIEVAAGWTPTNGTARPYKGDKSVYTSAEAVKINIKDATATTLYYSKCDTSLALTGTTYSKTFAAGTTQTAITEHLSDGLWAVWTNKGNDKEYFEYHDVSNIAISVNVVDGNFVFDVSDDNPWWYVVVPMHSKKIGFYPPDDDSNFVSITYEVSGNYSDYLEYATYISGNCYFFRKGTFGAYVIGRGSNA